MSRRPLSISLVIVNYRAADLCARLVSAVDGTAAEVIVVDNASPDGVAPLEDLAARGAARVLRLPVNVGYGSGANAGVREATGEVVVVANPDVMISAHGLRTLAEVAHGVGVAGPKLLFPSGRLQRSAHRREPLLLSTVFELCAPISGLVHRLAPDWHPTLYSSAAHERDLEPMHLLGAILAIDRCAWADVGGFDEDFFLYREETDLCRRVAAAGWHIAYCASVVAEHISGASSPQDRPLTAQPVWLESHYRYIAKRRGKLAARGAQALGLAATAVALLQRRRRADAWRAMRWHLGLRSDRTGS